MEDLVQWITQEKTNKLLRTQRFNLICNVILIIAILTIGIYIWYNIEAFKTLGQDVCRLCEIHTNATCFFPTILK